VLSSPDPSGTGPAVLTWRLRPSDLGVCAPGAQVCWRTRPASPPAECASAGAATSPTTSTSRLISRPASDAGPDRFPSSATPTWSASSTSGGSAISSPDTAVVGPAGGDDGGGGGTAKASAQGGRRQQPSVAIAGSAAHSPGKPALEAAQQQQQPSPGGAQLVPQQQPSPGGAQLVPSVSSLFPTDTHLLSNLQVVCARGCGLIDTDIQALCKCLSKAAAPPPSPGASGGGASGRPADLSPQVQAPARAASAGRAAPACASLTRLDLSLNHLSVAAVELLADELLTRRGGCRVRELDLSYNEIGDYATPGRGLRSGGAARAGARGGEGARGPVRDARAAGATASGSSPGASASGGALRHVNLAGNNLCAVSLTACVAALCPALHSAGLDLDLGNCGLSHTDLTILHTYALAALSLDDNALGDGGAACVASGVARGARGAWAGLHSLSLKNTCLGPEGARRLAGALARAAPAEAPCESSLGVAGRGGAKASATAGKGGGGDGGSAVVTMAGDTKGTASATFASSSLLRRLDLRHNPALDASARDAFLAVAQSVPHLVVHVS